MRRFFLTAVVGLALALPTAAAQVLDALPPDPTGIEPFVCEPAAYTEEEFLAVVESQLPALEVAGYGTGWRAEIQSIAPCAIEGRQSVEVKLFLPAEWYQSGLGIEYYTWFYGETDTFNLTEQLVSTEQLYEGGTQPAFFRDGAELATMIAQAEADTHVAGFADGLQVAQARVDADGNITYETYDALGTPTFFLTFGPSYLIDGEPTPWTYQVPDELVGSPGFPELALVDQIDQAVDVSYSGCALTSGYTDLDGVTHYSMYLSTPVDRPQAGPTWTMHYFSEHLGELVDLSACPNNVDVLITHDGSGYTLEADRYGEVTILSETLVAGQPVVIQIVTLIGGAVVLLVLLVVAIKYIIQYTKHD